MCDFIVREINFLKMTEACYTVIYFGECVEGEIKASKVLERINSFFVSFSISSALNLP